MAGNNKKLCDLEIRLSPYDYLVDSIEAYQNSYHESWRLDLWSKGVACMIKKHIDEESSWLYLPPHEIPVSLAEEAARVIFSCSSAYHLFRRTMPYSKFLKLNLQIPSMVKNDPKAVLLVLSMVYQDLVPIKVIQDAVSERICIWSDAEVIASPPPRYLTDEITAHAANASKLARSLQ